MTETSIIPGASQPVYIVNIDSDPDVAARPIAGGAAQPVYVTNFDESGGLNPELESIKIGDVDGGNYTEVEADGTVVAYGDAKCWKDILQSVTAARLTSPSSDFELNDPEGSITAKHSAR